MIHTSMYDKNKFLTLFLSNLIISIQFPSLVQPPLSPLITRMKNKSSSYTPINYHPFNNPSLITIKKINLAYTYKIIHAR